MDLATLLLAALGVLVFGVAGLAVWGLRLPDEDPFARERVRLANARDGQLIRVLGRVVPRDTLPSPRGRLVVMFRLELREPGAQRWSGDARALDDRASSTFMVDDGSGMVTVDGTEAVLWPPRGARFEPLDDGIGAYLDARGRRGDRWRATLRQRCIAVAPGDLVSVVGRCRREHGPYRGGARFTLDRPSGGDLHVRPEKGRSP